MSLAMGEEGGGGGGKFGKEGEEEEEEESFFFFWEGEVVFFRCFGSVERNDSAEP